MTRAALAAALAAACIAGRAAGAPRELCVYVAADGAVEQVNSIDAVPERYRPAARCFTEALKPERPRVKSVERPTGPTEAGRIVGAGAVMAPPDSLPLDGAVRRASLLSPLGRIELRWPRVVERLFGRTPERAMAEAARAVSRALKASAFPPELQNLTIEWQVVLMDEATPDGGIPAALVSNCHPGWMTPPANIYIAAQRVAAGCGGGAPVDAATADRELSNVLMHEFGHAIEYRILGREFGRSRARAEGFATWFNSYAADFSPLDVRGRVSGLYRDLARAALARGGSSPEFRGTAEDYALASMTFAAIVDRRGVRALLDVYQTMLADRLDFRAAIQRDLGWSEARLADEVRRVSAAGTERAAN